MVRNPNCTSSTILRHAFEDGQMGLARRGHHLSINFTMEGTQVVASSPCFFGANPAEVRTGKTRANASCRNPRTTRATSSKSLTRPARHRFQKKPFGEPEARKKAPGPATRRPDAAKMTRSKRNRSQAHQELHRTLPADVAAHRDEASPRRRPRQRHSPFSGSTEGAGKGFTYRVHGPTFLIEFSTCKPIRAATRPTTSTVAGAAIKGDFGLVRDFPSSFSVRMPVERGAGCFISTRSVSEVSPRLRLG